MEEQKQISIRAYVVYISFVVVMLAVLFQTFAIQFTKSDPQFETSNGEGEILPTRITKKTPRRGQILDVNYTPLVTSVSFFDIHFDPTVVDQKTFDRDLEPLCDSLAKYYPTKTSREYQTFIRKGRKNKKRYLLITKKATNQEKKRLHTFPIFEKGRLGGGLIDNEEIIIRKRPHGELLKRTLGSVKNGKQIGLEYAFNDYLKGEEGEQIEQKISTGWKKIGPVTKEAVEGANIITTIDKSIQEVAHSELLRQLENQEARNGCVIVMEVKTGYIKAIVNLSRGKDGQYSEAYNIAIGTKEDPGSTFKLASLMALLEDGKVSIHDKVNAKGHYSFYGETLDDSNHGRGYGTITIQEAFEKSSNVFSEIINDAYKNNPTQFIDRIKSFGLADTLGVKILGEPKPTLHEPGTDAWSGISLPWMAIGYEYLQTPLQTLTFYNSVANNGVLVKPQFVKEIRRGNDLIKTFPPVIKNPKICSNKTLQDLQTCLEGVVKRGTGKSLRSAFFDIAGKTGTAQVTNKDLKYGEDGEQKHIASFAGYFPAQDPIYSCIVVVSAPSKDYYGAVVSGTVFTAIANKVYASSLQYHQPINETNSVNTKLPISKNGNKEDFKIIQKELKLKVNDQSPSAWITTDSRGSSLTLNQRYISSKTVPNVMGMTAKDAVYLIERTGMRVKIEGYGKVIEQSVQAGEEIIVGNLITLKLEP